MFKAGQGELLLNVGHMVTATNLVPCNGLLQEGPVPSIISWSYAFIFNDTLRWLTESYVQRSGEDEEAAELEELMILSDKIHRDRIVQKFGDLRN